MSEAEAKGEAVLTVKIIRADGTVEDLGPVPVVIEKGECR